MAKARPHRLVNSNSQPISQLIGWWIVVYHAERGKEMARTVGNCDECGLPIEADRKFVVASFTWGDLIFHEDCDDPKENEIDA